MSDQTRPLALGYCRKHLLMTEAELADTRSRLAHFAAIEGFTVGSVYVERDDTAPAAFEALIEAVHRYGVAAVIVPSRLHLAVLGAPATLKDHFEQTTGARVLVAGISPP